MKASCAILALVAIVAVRRMRIKRRLDQQALKMVVEPRPCKNFPRLLTHIPDGTVSRSHSRTISSAIETSRTAADTPDREAEKSHRTYLLEPEQQRNYLEPEQPSTIRPKLYFVFTRRRLWTRGTVTK